MASKTVLVVAALLVMAAAVNASKPQKVELPSPHSHATQSVASVVGLRNTNAPVPTRSGLLSLGDTGRGLGGTLRQSTIKLPYPTAYLPVFSAGPYGFGGKK